MKKLKPGDRYNKFQSKMKKKVEGKISKKVPPKKGIQVMI